MSRPSVLTSIISSIDRCDHGPIAVAIDLGQIIKNKVPIHGYFESIRIKYFNCHPNPGCFVFRDMIQRRCNTWYASEECTVKEQISYIMARGAMRDAQIEAIKTYLFLKIACNNRPLPELFKSGAFNTLDLDEEELKSSTRGYLRNNPAASSFYEFCKMSEKEDKNIGKILKIIKDDPTSIDYDCIFDEVFGGLTYTDYIFSLPMGAGKTFLMAAFIYLDLYFSMIDPNNPAFAENFIIIAPSGLKNSIIPSLKTIEKFNPAWVIDEASAKQIKLDMRFDVLDAETSRGDSNKVKNPNARKIALYLQGGKTRAVTLVTNAEKVISDIKLDKKQTTLDGSEGDEMFLNELRALIARIPRLSVFIDEAHHVSSDEIKLRAVVEKWASEGNVVSVIGFTGTPYMEKAVKVPIVDKLKLSCTEITNVVHYYPLINGINNFLKVPEVKQYENRENYLEIVDDGLRSFFDNNLDFQYPNGACSKIVVYCNDIHELEEGVYPVAMAVASDYGLDPAKCILRYHEDKPGYKLAPDAKMNFETLDEVDSRIRVILLVQIGKEGWDCKSLASVILAKENRSTRNLVLQTCCRCLRQVVKYDKEKAWIYLCESNAEILEAQLKEQQHITLKEFQTGNSKPPTPLRFYNRRDAIDLPELVYYQFEVMTETISEGEVDTDWNLESIPLSDYRYDRIYKVADIQNRILDKGIEDNEHGDSDVDVANFNCWIGEIAKESYGFLTRKQFFDHEIMLRQIFDAITFTRDGVRYFSSKFDRRTIQSKIRQSFYAKRTMNTRSEYVIEDAKLLYILNFVTEKEVMDPDSYVPNQFDVNETIEKDKDGFAGREYMARRYHYMPYHLDSSFELDILNTLHSLTVSRFPTLEVYYNGDRFLSDFHIKCYEKVGPNWKYIGRYTPDFLILQRTDGEIFKAVILETKGSIYANEPMFKLKRTFVEEYFIKDNNERFGYPMFDYLYIQDDQPEFERLKLITDKINSFFEV